MVGWFLSRRDSTIVARHEVPCPNGAGGLSPGFQPWAEPCSHLRGNLVFLMEDAY
jgi:hypothetical protein